MREAKVDDFSTCKGQEKVAMEGEKEQSQKKLLMDEVGSCTYSGLF